MIRAVRNANAPIFFFQAANDYDLSPIYSAYGKSAQDGHTLGYFGAGVWANDVFRLLGQHCASQ